MGVFAATDVEDDRAADPEALLVFTLEVARRDPRLFDEVLDWLRVNERLVSVQRLRNLCVGVEDRELVEASLRWVSQYRKNPRFDERQLGDHRPPHALFGGSTSGPWRRDPYFEQLGLVRPVAVASRKSSRPDVTRPINFAFRARLAFGVGSRAEILRYLLTAPEFEVNAQLVAEVVGFAKRNVSEALDALAEAGLLRRSALANERRYLIDKTAWIGLLGGDPIPRYREWPQLLRAIRRIVRWLDEPSLGERSDSMRASAARDLMEEIEGDLGFAGVPVLGKTLPGARYWDGFSQTVEAALRALRT